jgi:carbonic anhydrase
MMLAADALVLLKEGNRRFVSDISNRDAIAGRARRLELAARQEPFAAILGCSDSRVPVEIVFDQGLGDLFVIRVAGNIVAPSHIEATLQQLLRPIENQSRNLHSIVDLIRPSVEDLLATDLRHDLHALGRAAVRANIRASVAHLRHGSDIIEQLIQKDGLMVVGAEYSLKTGVVEFFEGSLEDETVRIKCARLDSNQ